MTLSQKEKLLQKIAQRIENCSECKKGKTGKAVPGEGNPNAKIIFIGEAPGREEAKTGRPFIGRSGKLLRKILSEIGLNASEVFITSPVKYLPTYGTPTPADILHGRAHLLEQLKIIAPKIIVLLGSVACRALLGEKIPVIKEHGKIIRKKDQSYLITIHPAAAVRFPKLRSILVQDLQKIKTI